MGTAWCTGIDRRVRCSPSRRRQKLYILKKVWIINTGGGAFEAVLSLLLILAPTLLHTLSFFNLFRGDKTMQFKCAHSATCYSSSTMYVVVAVTNTRWWQVRKAKSLQVDYYYCCIYFFVKNVFSFLGARARGRYRLHTLVDMSVIYW